MIAEFLAGLAIGLVSGLIPGIHPNLVISVLGSCGIGGETLAILIIGLFPASLMSSFIPSIFFGVPEAGSAAAVLPGQRMVMRGEGLAALRTVLRSCAAAALISFALAYPMLLAFPAIYGAMRGSMALVLLALAAVMVLRSRSPLKSAAFFALSGAFGQASLNIGLADPFLPMFCGMFAIASIAAYRRGAVPRQEDGEAGSSLRFTAAGVGLGALAALVPGVGSPAQMASLITAFARLDTAAYLSAASAISVSQAILGLAASASIGKERVGAIAVLADNIDIGQNLLALSALAAVSFGISSGVLFLLRRRAAGIAGLDFSALNPILAAYLCCVCLAVDGPAGLLVLAAGTGLGWLALRLGVERTMLMGSIILPTLLLLFRIFI